MEKDTESFLVNALYLITSTMRLWGQLSNAVLLFGQLFLIELFLSTVFHCCLSSL